jgi:signal transduction histidine kinase/ActR/RegA family two-component response regulator
LQRALPAGRPTAFAMLPLVSDGRAIGVVSFGFDLDRAFPDEERRFLAALVRTCEQALDRARLYVAERAARRVAEDANRRKDEFLAMLNHELRNPLWAMVSALGVIDSSRDGATGRELSIISRQVEHLTEIVNGLLDFSQVSRGQIQLRREPVPLASSVTSALDGARPLIDRRAHEISVDIAGDLVVDADRQRLRQVLEHLLTNAVKYTGDHGRIAITAAPDGPFIRISVRDNGRGIAPPLLAELFEPFVQGEQPLDRRDGGLGIGLTLVRTLVELHGGTIEAHSDGPGTGATFTLRWPQGSPGPSPGDGSLAAQPAVAKPRRVLVVDDNSDAADMLAMLLRALGHEVALALDGAAALDSARAFAPHVALLDIGLPGMDGYELARRLRALDTCKQTLLVAVTGYGESGDRQRSKAAGFAHHFVKPVNPVTFKTLLASLADDDTG